MPIWLVKHYFWVNPIEMCTGIVQPIEDLNTKRRGKGKFFFLCLSWDISLLPSDISSLGCWTLGLRSEFTPSALLILRPSASNWTTAGFPASSACRQQIAGPLSPMKAWANSYRNESISTEWVNSYNKYLHLYLYHLYLFNILC